MSAPLLSVADYAAITGDTTTGADVVTARLAAAQSELEEYLLRPLGVATLTETLPMFTDGRVYPSNPPIQSVALPATAIIDGNAIIGVMPSVGGGWDMLVNNALTIWPYPRVIVTYTGGYTSATLPQKLRRAIARLAQVAGVPANLSGARLVRVGDLSVDYGSSANSAPDAVHGEILRSVYGYRRQLQLP